MKTTWTSRHCLATVIVGLSACTSAPGRPIGAADPPDDSHPPPGADLVGATIAIDGTSCIDADGDGAGGSPGCIDIDCDDADAELGALFETDCGRCVKSCQGESLGAGTNRPFDTAPPLASGVVVDGDGILLPSNPVLMSNRFLWITEPQASVVVKLEQATGVEVARYRTAATLGAEPRLVAVAPDGRALVLNHRTATAVIVAASDCPDQDGDGTVTSSSRRGELLAWRADECVLGELALEDAPRGVAIVRRSAVTGSTRPFGWIASGATLAEVDLDGIEQTGRIVTLESTHTPTVTDIRALAAGRDGILWAASATALFSVDPRSAEVRDFPLPTPRDALDLAVAPDGAVWLTGSKGACRYDPAGSTFELIGGACGSAIAIDDRGVPFVAQADRCEDKGLARIDPVSKEVTEAHFSPPATITSVAVALDGWVWGISSEGSAFRVHPDTLVSDLDWFEGGAAQVQGDFTGAALASVLAEPGRLTTTLVGCGDRAERTNWSLLRWYADVPAGTSLVFEVRVAETHADLAHAPKARIAAATTVGEEEQEASVADALAGAGGAQAEFLEVTAVLESPAHAELPRLASFEAYHACSPR